MESIYELKNKALDLGEAVKNAKDEYNAILDDPKSTTEAVEAAKAKFDNRVLKYNAKKELIKQAEAQQQANLHSVKRAKANDKLPEDPKARLTRIEAAYIRKTVRPNNAEFQEKWNVIKQELKDDNGDGASNGGDLLPITVSNQLVSEPFETNPLRQIETISTITNLILPKIAYEIADDGFIKDGDPAKDMKLTAGNVTFGRNEMKVRAGVSDAILKGTDTGLVQYINNALSSAIQTKERNLALGTSNSADLAHMSFYDTTTVNIKKITGSDLYEAITLALADLDDAFQDRAKIVMSRTDYYKMIKSLANNSTDLFGRKPEEVLGYPVVFTSKATTPIVGDFSHAQLNYEIASSLYEQYKDYEHGMNYFQFTTWFDHQIVLPSAFRLAEVGGGSGK